jgi:uncharacterized membrane protein
MLSLEQGRYEMKYIYILGCIFFTVFGQLLVKLGAAEVREAKSLFTYMTNKFIVIAFFTGVLAALSWVKALQFFNLSYAYPFMSLSFLLVALFSVLIFGEAMKLNQWIGLGIVLFGLYIGSR